MATNLERLRNMLEEDEEEKKKSSKDTKPSAAPRTNTSTGSGESNLDRLKETIGAKETSNNTQSNNRRKSSYKDWAANTFKNVGNSKNEVAENAASIPVSTPSSSNDDKSDTENKSHLDRLVDTLNSPDLPDTPYMNAYMGAIEEVEKRTSLKEPDEQIEAKKKRYKELDKILKRYNAEYASLQDNPAENKWLIDGWADKNGIAAVEAEYKALEKELEEYKYDDYLDDVYEDTFSGRFHANLGQGTLAEASSAAWNEYYKNPTDENFENAIYLDALEEKFATNNKDVVGKGGLIDKSLASYIPQAVNKAKIVLPATAGGAAAGAGAALALNATGVLAVLPEEVVTVPSLALRGAYKGLKASHVAATAVTSFENMRGYEFGKYLLEGVEMDTARTAANEAALAMAAIESGEAVLDVLPFGKAAGKAISATAISKLLKSYGFNIVSEGLEEALQEVISITALERAKNGETGTWELIEASVKKLGSLSEEEKAQVVESGVEGSKLAVILGGATRVANTAVEQGTNAVFKIANKGIEAHNNKIYNKAGAAMSEADVVDDVIATGLESAPDTESYKLAEELQAKREAGETITDREVGRLYAENVKTIREEEASGTQQEAENDPTGVFDGVDEETVEELRKLAEEAGEEPSMASLIAKKKQENEQSKAEGYNAIMTPEDKFLNEQAKAVTELEQQSNELKIADSVRGLGDNGAKALGAYYDNQNNFDDYYNGFSRYYDAGVVGLPFEQVDTVYSRNISPAVQQAAYMAGVNDAKASLAKDVANQRVYYPNGKLVKNENSEKLWKGDRDFLNIMSSITGTEIELVGENTIRVGTNQYGFDEFAFGSYSNGRIKSESVSDIIRHITIAHELNHSFQVTAPKQYRTFRDYAVQVAESHHKGDKSAVELYMERYGSTREEAMDEIASDFTQKLFKDRREMQKFIEDNMQDVKKRSMLEKFFDAVHAFIKRVETALSKNKKTQAEADAEAIHDFGATVEELKQARQLWLDELKAANKAVDEAKTVENKNRQAYNESTKTNFSSKKEDNYAAGRSIETDVRNLERGGLSQDGGRRGGVQGKILVAGTSINGTQWRELEEIILLALDTKEGRSILDAYGGKKVITDIISVALKGSEYDNALTVFYTGLTLSDIKKIREIVGNKHKVIATTNLTAEDKAYFNALKSDKAKAEQMVKEAAEKAGYKLKAFHFTDADFTVFKFGEFGFHVGTLAQASYIGEGNTGKILNLYVKSENPLYWMDTGYWSAKEIAATIDPDDSFDDFDNQFEIQDKVREIAKIKNEKEANAKLREYLESLGYDSIKYENTQDRHTSEPIEESYILFDANQLKSADVVTYDDNGKAIPLSQRFDAKQEDIRFSRKDSKDNDLNSIEAKYKDKTDYLFLNEKNDGTITIANMVIKPKYRNQGVGTQILNDVIAYADKNGKTITLTPTTEFGTKTRLTKWYKANGFVENKGRNTDYRLSDTMYRLPQSDSSNVRYSRKDSSGRQLSKEQQEYFKDSKVRDDEGNLLVMYQGNTGDFTVFDRKKSKASNLHGRGFYFTRSESHAAQYGNASPYYLNIKNPLMPDQHNITKQQLKNFLKEVAANEDDYGLDNYGYGATVESVLNSIYGKGDFEAIQDVSLTAIGDLVEAVELFNEVNGTSYDGIVLAGETVVFNSNQIKNIDNLNPTDDPDIRYSLKNGETVYAPAMYSQLEKTVEGYKGDKISANGLIPYLKGKGVKDEEIKWSGIATYIEGKKSVSKADLLGFLTANELYIDEQTLQGDTEKFVTADGERILNSKDDFKDYVEMYVEDRMFMDYIPYDVTYEFGDDRWEAIGHYEDDDGDKWTDIIMQADPEEVSTTKWHDYILEDDGNLGNYRELLFILPDMPYSNQAMNVHWERSGVLAHARVQDALDPDTDEVFLFVEEIQSDWHNEGKKKGYMSEGVNKFEALQQEAADKRAELVKMTQKGALAGLIDRVTPFFSDNKDYALNSLYTNKHFVEDLRYERGVAVTEEEIRAVKSFKEVQQEVTELTLKIRRAEATGELYPVPDAPFRDSYVNYVLKRLIRDCAERGISKLAWTTSDIQADRWSEDFREGYRIEYDIEIPKFLKKYGKQWGAALGQTEVAGYTVPYIEINEKMRESVLYEGQPRFSMKKPVEETKNLIALHNVYADKLEEALKLGGFPMPSIAIVKSDAGHSKYGEISFVFSKDTIDPQIDSRNLVYGGDAYTPTAPMVEYPVNYDVLRKFEKNIEELSKGVGGGIFFNTSVVQSLGIDDTSTMSVKEIVKKLSAKDSVRAAFAASQGEKIEPEYRLKKFDNFGNDALRRYIDKVGAQEVARLTVKIELGERLTSEEIETAKDSIMDYWIDSRKDALNKKPELKEKRIAVQRSRIDEYRVERFISNASDFYHDGGTISDEIDPWATGDKLERFVRDKDVSSWVSTQLEGLLGEPAIYNGKEPFTSGGHSRSFEELHYPYTLENIVRVMAETQPERGGQVFGISAGALQATASKSYSNISDVKKDSDRLGAVEGDVYDAKVAAVDADISEVIKKIRSVNKAHSDNTFDEEQIIGSILMDAAKGKKTIDNIVRTFSKEGYKVSNQVAKDIQNVYKNAATLPTEYFEAKPKRAVSFDEVLAAVVPETTNENVINQLKEYGVKVLTYKFGDEQSRLEAVNSVEGARFSRKGTSDILRENARLKEYNDYLKEQMKLTKELKLDKKALEKMAKNLIKEYDSNIDATELYNKLNGVYSYLLNTEQPLWEELKSRAVEVARDIVSDATVVNDELYQSYSNLRNYLKYHRISISDIDKRSLSDGYNNFRKANYGRINLVNNGSPVDMIYQELAEMHPEFFDAERYTHPAEQLEHIAEVLDSLRPYEENPYEHNMSTVVEYLANDIIERYYDVPQAKPTFADKQQKKLDKQKYEDAVKLNQLRKEKNAKIEDAELATIMHEGAKAAKRLREQQSKFNEELVAQRNRLKQLRKEKNAKIDAIKEHQKAKESRMSDKRKRKVLRSRIIKHITPMREKLLRPSDKHHVPQEMRLAVAALLDAINLESGYTYDPETGSYKKSDAGLPTRRTQELEKLKKQYQEILGTDAGADMVIDPSLLGDTAAGIGSNLDKLIDMRDIRLDDMTMEQLTTVWEVVRAVEASIFYAGKMLSQQKYQTTSSFAEAFVSDTETRKSRKSFGNKKVSLDLENPYTFFSHFGQAGKDFFRMLRNAQDEAKLIDIELAERMKGIASSEQRKSLEKDLQKFTTVRGDELTLSKAHIMNIYLLSKRPQAEGHLLRGGIVQPEINRKIHRGTDTVQLTAQDVNELIRLLTPEEKKIADGLQKLTLFLAEKGNEATMKVYGYEKFTDPNYWTIKSAKEGLLQTVEEGQDLARSIRNMGSAKQVVPNASNPLEIGSAFEVFDAHASDMITYSVWLAPMEDSTRLFNFRFRDAKENLTGKTMKGLLNRVGGAGSDAYWMNLMRDIQNGISSPADDVMSTVVNKTIGNVKKASVAGNIRVIVQQPTAYLRAMVVLSPADMIAGVTKELASGLTRNGGWKKAVKHSPIAAIKQTGGFEVSANMKQLSEIIYEPNTKKGKAGKFIKDLPLMGASAADAVTWGAIWNACERKVARTHEDLAKGSDSFNKAVKELFAEVIDQSQVVDGVLQRSQIMRSSNALNKQASAFMGEPILSLNLLMRSYDAWVNETSSQKRSAALKTAGRAAVALIASNVVVAIAQSAVDALRDDEEDKEYLERFMTALTGLQGDEETLIAIGKNIALSGNIGNQLNPATYIPYVKDIVSILQGYTVERMDAGVYSDLISATENVIKSLNGEGKWTTGYAVAKMMTIGAKLFGSSSANVMRDVESLVRSLFIETDNWKALYDMEKQMYDVNKQKSRFLDILYQAMKAGDMETYNAIVTDLIDAGIEPSSIKNGMSSRAKKDEEVSTEASSFDSTLAGLGLKYNYIEEEEAEEEKFTVDNLSGEEYVRYNEVSTEMFEDIVSDLQRYGLEDLDEETANALINAAYSYVNNVALEDASGGEYEIDTKWINAAGTAYDDLGLSVAEYIMLKEEYGASALTTDGIFTAYDAGVDPELYLEVKDNINDMKADKDANGKSISGSKKNKVIEYLNGLELTEEEYGALMEAAGYKNPFE